MKNLLLGAFLIWQSILLAQEIDLSVASIPEDLKKNANSVIRLDETDVTVHSVSELSYKRRKVVTLLNKKGMRSIRTAIRFDPFVRIKSAEILIYNEMGERIETIKRRFFKERSAVDGFSLYTDSRVLYYSYKPVAFPITIEFSYEINAETGNLPQWRLLNSYGTSCQRSKYTLNYGKGFLKPSFKESNLEAIKIEKFEFDNQISYEAVDVKAIKFETYSPPFEELAPLVYLRLPEFDLYGVRAKINSWNDVANWRKELLKGRQEISLSTKNKITSMVSGIDDDLEKAKIIHKYIQENTRYVSVQEGIGGLQPIAAIDVDNVKYGDCKGLTNYMMALLKAVDVTSYYVVVEAGNEKISFDESYADFIQGNHVILVIPYEGKFYWVDSTSQEDPFGFLGTFTDDRKVLVLTPEGGKIMSTPSYLNEENLKETIGKCSLNTDGSISGDLKILTKGTQYDYHCRLEKGDAEQIDEYYKEFWSHINNLSLEKYSFENDKETIKFKETVKVSANSFANTVGNRMLFSGLTFAQKTSVPPRHRNRKYPMEIQRGFLDKDTYEVTLPTGYSVETLPEPTKIENKFGEYSISFSVDGNLLNIERKLLIKAGEYPNTDYDLYRTFKRKISKSDKRQIALIFKV